VEGVDLRFGIAGFYVGSLAMQCFGVVRPDIVMIGARRIWYSERGSRVRDGICYAVLFGPVSVCILFSMPWCVYRVVVKGTGELLFKLGGG
jgi:hypothetical protein